MVVHFTTLEAQNILRKFYSFPEDTTIFIGEPKAESIITEFQKLTWMVLTHPKNHEQKIPRIKLLREIIDAGLKDAKEAIENIHGYGSAENFVQALKKIGRPVWNETPTYNPLWCYSYEQAKKDLLIDKLKSV